jgi:hypothetical protein
MPKYRTTAKAVRKTEIRFMFEPPFGFSEKFLPPISIAGDVAGAAAVAGGTASVMIARARSLVEFEWSTDAPIPHNLPRRFNSHPSALLDLARSMTMLDLGVAKDRLVPSY